jgi:hypothetical protein
LGIIESQKEKLPRTDISTSLNVFPVDVASVLNNLKSKFLSFKKEKSAGWLDFSSFWGYTLLPLQGRLLSHARLKAGADLIVVK